MSLPCSPWRDGIECEHESPREDDVIAGAREKGLSYSFSSFSGVVHR
jgi:hypothetical protein